MPAYRIGPSDFFTSADLLADAKTLNGQINGLNDANWDAPPELLFASFQAFLSDWRGFYSSTFDGIFGNWSGLNDANRDQLIQFEQRFAELAAAYQDATGARLPVSVIAPSSGAKDTFGSQILNQLQPLIPQIDAKTLAIVLGVVVVGVAVFFFRAPLLRALGKGAA